jgi:hypothetical protein
MFHGDSGRPQAQRKLGLRYFIEGNRPLLNNLRAGRARQIKIRSGDAMVKALRQWLDTHELPAIIAAVVGVVVALSVLMVVGGYLAVAP